MTRPLCRLPPQPNPTSDTARLTVLSTVHLPEQPFPDLLLTLGGHLDELLLCFWICGVW